MSPYKNKTDNSKTRVEMHAKIKTWVVENDREARLESKNREESGARLTGRVRKGARGEHPKEIKKERKKKIEQSAERARGESGVADAKAESGHRGD